MTSHQLEEFKNKEKELVDKIRKLCSDDLKLNIEEFRKKLRVIDDEIEVLRTKRIDAEEEYEEKVLQNNFTMEEILEQENQHANDEWQRGKDERTEREI